MICLDKLHKSNVLIKGRQETSIGTSLVVQWLRLCASNAGGMALIPGQGTKIPHMPHGMAKNIHIYTYIYVRSELETVVKLVLKLALFQSSVTIKNETTSLVVQWLRIQLPKQGTQV